MYLLLEPRPVKFFADIHGLLPAELSDIESEIPTVDVKKTSYERPFPFDPRLRPVQLPFTPRSAPVCTPFGSRSRPVHIFDGCFYHAHGMIVRDRDFCVAVTQRVLFRVQRASAGC